MVMIFVEIHLSDADLRQPTSSTLCRTLDPLALSADEIRVHLWAVTSIDDAAREALLDLLAMARLRGKRVAFVDVSHAAACALGLGVVSGSAPPVEALV